MENIASLQKDQPGLSKRPELPKHQPDNVLFPEEQVGWHGYVEWEKYPDKAKRAAEILANHQFASVSPLDVDAVTPWLIEVVSCSLPSSN